ncbi:MAG: putative extracytoplasmic binding receptor [Pseudomonadota bacterium]|jgi:tripartite-type tricarboxylate transporter receptor subunit TctC|nr:tripartite tricarboxylate transporter substrate binding protein [Betaproteobacteria bacterium]
MSLPTSFRRSWMILALSAFVLSPAQAQRVIHMVVPFGPGAVQDVIARTFNAELGRELGATVVVENRAGAGGTVGTGQVAKAAPDGNTLVLSAASHTLAGHLYPKLAYDPIKDFVGVSLIGYSGYVIAAPSNLGVNNLAEYVRLLKSKPGQTNYASAGNGSATHLGMASFLAKAGVEMQHIPMKSTGDAVNEVLAGRVQGVTSATIGVVGYRQDPRIKLLAYTGPQRSKYLPELPTVSEAGFTGFRFDSWLGVLAPSGTPAAEVQRLNAAIQKAIADPAVQERLTRLGVEQNTSNVSSDEFQKILRADWDTAGQIVKASGARLE